MICYFCHGCRGRECHAEPFDGGCPCRAHLFISRLLMILVLDSPGCCWCRPKFPVDFHSESGTHARKKSLLSLKPSHRRFRLGRQSHQESLWFVVHIQPSHIPYPPVVIILWTLLYLIQRVLLTVYMPNSPKMTNTMPVDGAPVQAPPYADLPLSSDALQLRSSHVVT